MDWLTQALATIKEAQVAKILKEQVGLLQLQRDQAVAERDVLATKLAQANAKIEILESDNIELKSRLDDHADKAKDGLVPFKGALWKRKKDGSFCEDVFCRKCHQPMTSACMKTHNYRCESCNVRVDFTGLSLRTVMSELLQHCNEVN